MILNRFPVEYQMDSQDCGPASLKIIAKHFGKFYSLQFLRDRCGITKEGVSLLDLSTGAESIGLRTLAVKCTITDVVKNVPLPAIIFGRIVILLLSITLIRNIFGFQILQKGVLNIRMMNFVKAGIRRMRS